MSTSPRHLRLRAPFARLALPALAGALVLAALPSIGTAQSPELDPRVRGEAGAVYRSWEISDSTDATTTIAQLYLPFAATVPFGARFDMVAFGAFANSTLKFGDEENGSLSGVTDFRIKGFWRPGDRAFLAVGVNLPVGKQTLRQGTFGAAGRPQRSAGRDLLAPKHDGTDAGAHHEVEVAQALWSPLLGFRAKRMAQGFDLDLSAGTAFALSPRATLGLGAGYLLKGEYDFIETEDGVIRFKPAGEVSGSIGLDLRPNEDLLFRLDVAARAFGDDEQSGLKVFHAATQIELDALLAGRSTGWNWLVRARDVVKGDDEILSDSGGGLSRTAQPSVDSFWAVGELYRNLSPAFALGGTLEYGSFGASELTVSDGHTLSVGPGLRIGRSEATHVRLRGSILSGTAEDGALDLSGLDVSAVVSFKL